MPSKLEVLGNEDNLKRVIREDAYKKIEESVNKALNDAKKLLQEKLEEIYAPLEVEVEGIIASAEQTVNAEKAALEMEKKKRLEELKKKYIEKVIEEAWKRALKEAEEKSERYKFLLEKALVRMSEEAGEDEVEVYALNRDLDLVKEIIESKGLKNLSVGGSAEEKGLSIKGGVVGKSKKGAVWYNYSLEKLFGEVIDASYSKVLEVLTEGLSS